MAPDYATGPSTYQSSRPILDAYADFDALARACPNCAAAVGAYCVLGGVLRKVPCMARTRGGDA